MSSLHRLARQSFLHRRLLHPRSLLSKSDRNPNPSPWKEEEDASSVDRITPVRAKIPISHISVAEHDIDATLPSKMKVQTNRHPHLIGLVESIRQSKVIHAYIHYIDLCLHRNEEILVVMGGRLSLCGNVNGREVQCYEKNIVMSV